MQPTAGIIAALYGIHCLTGADITGSFARKGKRTCWKNHDTDGSVLSASADLGVSARNSDDTVAAIEAFVYQLYLSDTVMQEVKYVRWRLFVKNQS